MKLLTGLSIAMVVLCFGCHSEAAGDVISVNCDQSLSHWDFENGKWGESIPGCCCAISMTIIAEGVIYGVGPDNSVYKKTSFDEGAWEGPISGSCCVKDVDITAGGIVIGISTDNKVVANYGSEKYYRWREIKGGSGMQGLTVQASGRILGVTKKGNLMKLKNLFSDWKNYDTSGGKVIDVSEQSDGSIIGVTPNHGLTILGPDNVWGPEIPNSQCVNTVVTENGTITQ
ncbi:uncharacterized protein LOC144452925 [Glandiceps talaboti]